MSRNMFQEGLYQVYWEQPASNPVAADTNQEELQNVRIHRWFGTVVNTRLLITGVVQVLSGLACLLTTVSYTCLRYSCSVSMTIPVFSSLFYVATGGLALEVQRKPNRLKVSSLTVLNLVCLLLVFSALLASSLNSTKPTEFNTNQQLAGAYLVKGSSVVFTVQCLLASVYTLFLSYRGLRRYSSPQNQTYGRLSQDPDGHTDPLLEQEQFSIGV